MNNGVIVRVIKLVFIILVLGALFCGCCSIKARFNPEELKWLSVYEVGDTLVFMSQSGEIDTTYIIGKRVRHIECNPYLSYEGLFRPILGNVYYGKTPEEEISTLNSLVGLIKDRNKTSLHISYLFGSILFFDMNEEVWKYNDGGVYVFDTSHPKSKPEYPVLIYWHENHGIIKYITHSGVEWKRINLDFEVE